MRGWVIGFWAAVVFATGPGCDKCKNPQREQIESREGPVYQCNARVTCAGHQGPDFNKTLEGTPATTMFLRRRLMVR